MCQIIDAFLFSNFVLKTQMQVLDFAVFPEPEFDVPIFCANFFATTNTSIMVL